jgi:hypothetical protein
MQNQTLRQSASTRAFITIATTINQDGDQAVRTLHRKSQLYTPTACATLELPTLLGHAVPAPWLWKGRG